MNHVPPARRLLTVLSGYIAAAIAGGVIPIAGYALLVRIAHGPTIALVLPSAAFTFLKMAGISLLPTALVIAITERFSIRAVFAYVLLGVAILIGCTIYMVMRDGLALYFAVLSGMTSAGIVAGLVYWQIAGRDAGAWRSPENR